jgi:hypothetical protein
MGKTPRAPENARGRWSAAKCSSCWGYCWSRYSAISFLILKMGGDMRGLLETVSYTWGWGNAIFSTAKTYKALTNGQCAVHPIFRWLWKSKCQIKYKMFFWLLLKDQLSARDILRRKGMISAFCRNWRQWHILFSCAILLKPARDRLELQSSPQDLCPKFLA